jgi:putative flippase GtrA
MQTNATTQRDYVFGAVAGIIIGLLIIPVIKAVKPSFYGPVLFVAIPIFTAAVPIGLVIASWISRRFAFIWQLAKFVVIGGMNMLVDLGVLALISSAAIAPEATWLSFSAFTITYYSLYKASSFIVANINSYLWNKYWTFEASENRKAGTEFLGFFVVSLIGFAMNVVAASAVFSAFHRIDSLTTSQWGLIGAVVGSITGLAWNFIGYKFIVFKK